MSYRPNFAAKSTVTRGTVYRNMLENFRVAQLDDDMRPHLLFQQDYTPPLLLRHARNFLYSHYAGKSSGRGDPVSWPRRSPDLTFHDFTAGNLLRISRTCLRFPTTLNCWGSWFHKPSCTDELIMDRTSVELKCHWDVYVLLRERLWNFRKPTSYKTRMFCITFYVIDFRT